MGLFGLKSLSWRTEGFFLSFLLHWQESCGAFSGESCLDLNGLSSVPGAADSKEGVEKENIWMVKP